MKFGKEEFGIKVPPKGTPGRKKKEEVESKNAVRYPFYTMKRGSSILVIGVETREERSKISMALGNARKKHPSKKFTTRKMENGIRVFRTM